MSSTVGSALYFTFVSVHGTAVMNGDFRQFNETLNVSKYDETAGADTHMQYLKGILDGTYSITFLRQDGDSVGGIAGTLLIPGLSGTIVLGREGTTTGKVKETAAAFIETADQSQPYNDVVEYSFTFQRTAAPAYTTW